MGGIRNVGRLVKLLGAKGRVKASWCLYGL